MSTFTLTPIASLSDIVGTQNFKFTIRRKLQNDYNQPILEVTILSPVQTTIFINEPKGKKWVEYNPVIGSIEMGKLQYYDKHGRWSLVPIGKAQNQTAEGKVSTEEIVEDMQNAPKTYTTTLTNYRDLPIEHRISVTVPCHVLDLTVVTPSAIILLGGKPYRITVPAGLDPHTVHNRFITIQVRKSHKKASLKVVALGDGIPDDMLAELDVYSLDTKIVTQNTEVEQEISTTTVAVGSTWGNTTGVATVIRIFEDTIDEVVWYRVDGKLSCLSITDFQEQFTKSTMWFDNIPETGVLVLFDSKTVVRVLRQTETGKLLTDFGDTVAASSCKLICTYEAAVNAQQTTNEEEIPF